MVVRSPVCYLLLLLITLAACDSQVSNGAAAALRAQALTLPRELQAALERDARVPVIVSLRERTLYSNDRAARVRAIAAQQRALQSSLAELAQVRNYRHTPAFAATLSREEIARVLQDPDVASVQIDHPGRAQLMEAVPLVQAARVHSTLGLTGKGVRIAVLDTGIEASHPDLRDAVVAQRCFLRAGCPPLGLNEGSDAKDDNGHGTSITGVIASRGLVSARGFAPEAEIVALKVLANDSTGTESDWVAALDWLYDNLDKLQVKLVNLSFVSEQLFADGACDRAAPALAAAIANLTRAGVAVFGASGNNGSSTQLAVPACDTGVIAVGASYDADVGPMPGATGSYKRLVGENFADCRDETTGPARVTCYSNTSPRLDLIAPGSPITSDWIGGGTSQRGGTSYAAAAATGVAALLLQCNPQLEPNRLRKVLSETGSPLKDARNGLSFPLVQAADATVEACLLAPVDAGMPHAAGSAAAPSVDAAVPPLDAAVRAVPAADAAVSATAGSPPKAADASQPPSDAATAELAPIERVKIILPKREPKAPASARAANGCACAVPRHMQGWSAYACYGALAFCSCARRLRRALVRMSKSLPNW